MRSLLDESQYASIELDGRDVRDKATFLQQAKSDRPYEQGLEPHNWDAFADCLWWGLAATNSSRVAILWTDAHNMLEGGLEELLVGVSCFEAMSRAVTDTEHGFPRPMVLRTFLLGEGPNFPRLDAETAQQAHQPLG